MLKSIAENKWVRQLAVALGYAIVYNVIHPYSAGIWAVTAGLRLSCLLIFPYRYWPALVAGELISISYINSAYAGKFGTTWAVVSSLPPMLVAAPIVWWCKRKLSLFPSKRIVRVNALLACIVLVTVTWTALVYFEAATAIASARALYTANSFNIIRMCLGRYVGILTILPLVLSLKLQKPTDLRTFAQRMMKSRAGIDFIMLLLPSLAILVWLNLHAPDSERQVICIAMFLPVAWLTSKYGWRASAAGTTLAMASIFVSTPSLSSPGHLEIQAFIAFASTCLFALGARISAQNAIEEQERLDAQAAVKIAQQSLYANEVKMRQTAQALEQIGGTLQLTQTRLLNRFKHMLPLTEGQTYFKQAATTQSQLFHLAESMHPTAWRERGLPAALRETIARSLDESGLAYRFRLTGRELSQLSSGVHAAIYRLACEAVVYISEQQEWGTIAITLRGGHTNGQRWATLRVEGLVSDADINDPVYAESNTQHLSRKLGAHGIGISGMRDHVRLFDGDLRVRAPQGRFQITALLLDANRSVRASASAYPARELCIR